MKISFQKGSATVPVALTRIRVGESLSDDKLSDHNLNTCEVVNRAEFANRLQLFVISRQLKVIRWLFVANIVQITTLKLLFDCQPPDTLI